MSDCSIFLKFSSLACFKRILVWCLRFLKENKNFRQFKDSQVQELENVEKSIVRAAQSAEFKCEIELLSIKNHLQKLVRFYH